MRPAGARPWIDRAAAALIIAASLAGLVATSPAFGMVWDEGHTVRRERLLADWFAKLAEPSGGGRSGAGPFSEESLARYWPFSREEPDGHPPFYALLGLAGWWPGRGFLDPLTAYRLGPMVLAAVATGLLYLHLAGRFGRLAAITAAAALLLMPRSFAHAHYAHYDMPMTCLWVLATIGFARSLSSPRWIVPFGVATGLCMGTKFTGWFAPVAPVLWTAWHEGLPALRGWLRGEPPAAVEGVVRRRPGVRTLALGLPVAALTLYVIHPPWWRDPLGGVLRFLASNLTRDETKPIPTLYAGTVYEFALPWHNTLVLTAITVPVLLLVLGLLGIVAGLARGRPGEGGWGGGEPRLWVLSWAVLMIVRALPNAPGHDGVRLFLPSIASLAVLAGLGAGWLADRLRGRRLGPLAAVVASVAVGESVWGVYDLYPYTLSYYNQAFGGLRAAEARGFELTYYWDTMGPEFLAWVRREGRSRPIELRFPSDLVNVGYLREWGDLPRDVRIVGREEAVAPDYVLQRRRGVYYPYDWWLDRHGRPSFTIRRQGVDLLRVYPYAESLRAYESTRDIPIPFYLQH